MASFKELYLVNLIPFVDTNIPLLPAGQNDIADKDEHPVEEANESGCVGSLLYFSQSCEYKKLWKNVSRGIIHWQIYPQ